MAQNIITAGDATSAALTSQGGNDGTLVLVVGPNGGKLNALSFDATGVPTFIKQPVVPVQSMVRLNTVNGYGTTNTMIKRFLNTVINQGVDITYADSATLGATFTINANGIYAISYSDSGATACGIGISLNSNQLTTSISNITISAQLAITASSAANFSAACGVTVTLVAGDVIRAHADATAVGTPNRSVFTITRVA